jgi:hypothetical protein
MVKLIKNKKSPDSELRSGDRAIPSILNALNLADTSAS